MSHRSILTLASLLTCLALWATPATAQEPEAAMEAWMKAGKPGKQHERLAALVGTWQAETKFWMDASAPPMTAPGTIEYRMVMGGRFLEEKVSSEFMGSPFSGMGLYGYDNITGKLQAMWIDDMSTGIYSYSGSMNEAGDEMVLSSRFKDPMSGTWKESRSVMKISRDKLHYISYEKAEDGAERKVMEITATRKASR